MKEAYNKIYLDTSLIFEWFRLRIIKRKKKSEELEIIRFLSEHTEIEKYISFFSITEIIAKLRKQFKEKVTIRQIDSILKILQNTIKLDIIKIEEFKNKEDKIVKGFLISPEVIDFAFDCFDAKDAIHIDIAKNNDLLFVTRDDDAQRVKSYSKIMGERKFRKQFKD